MEMQHEPGPWRIDPEDETKSVTISRSNRDIDGTEWETLVAIVSIIDGESGNANLRLILAAPDLLQAAISAAEAIRQSEPDIALLYLENTIAQAFSWVGETKQ